MNEAVRNATPAVTNLLEADEEELYEQLAVRAAALAENPQLGGDFALAVTYNEVATAPLESFRDVGIRIFNGWSPEAYALVCRANDEDRGALLDAIETGQTTFAALLASALVTTFGLAPAIAAVVAAIVANRFFRPDYDEFCAVWQETLFSP